MAFRFSALTLIFFAFFGGFNALAKDDTTLVPIDGTEAPAVDLVYQGRRLDQDQALDLRQKGKDLSKLDPVANDMWGKPAKNDDELPADGSAVEYDSALAGFGHEISIHRVTFNAKPLKLAVSTVSHRALLTRALLAKLGFNQSKPRRYHELTIRFHSVEERQEFLDAVTLDTVKKPSVWVKSMPSGSRELVLQDVMLESAQADLQNYYWSILSSKFSGGRRALRSLLMPIALCDSPENIDSFHWDVARVLNNSLLVPYPREVDGQRPFDDTTLDDMRWIARWIAKLTASDWQKIVEEADYPRDIAEIVLQKLLGRRNQMLVALGVEGAPLPYNAHLNNDSVKNGEVIRATFPGYASRFSYGDAEDPMRPTEILDLGLMQGLASGMGTLSAQLNKYLSILSTDTYAQKQQLKMLEDFFKHLLLHPGEPYSKPITTWGGPVAGFKVDASRQVTTGSFYGSNAPIQLVDTMAVTGSAGYFRGLDGLKNIIPGLQAELSVSRSYTHLRSLNRIGDSLKVSAKSFIVPRLLSNLSKILENPKPQAALADKSKQLADYSKAVEDLLEALKDGEMFTITDTAAAGMGAQVRIPLQALFPAMPVGYNQNITFGAGIKGVILRRTTFRRVHDELSDTNYLQIYVQSLNSETGNLTLDFNFFINVLHLGASHSRGKAQTRVFTVESKKDRDQEGSRHLAESVRSLLRSNSDAMLRSNYPYYLLKHTMDTKDWDVNFLFIQAKELEERHLLRIQPPREADHPFDPKDFERTFFSFRKLSRVGNNFLSLLSNITNSVTKGQGSLASGSGDNPAYSPYGSAHWTETYADAELSKGVEFQPVTISREVWAGWSLSRDKLFKVLDSVDSKLRDLGRFGIKLSPIHRDVFSSTQKLEFYTVAATAIFYPRGVNRIIAALRPEADPSFSPLFLSRGDSYSASDKAVYKTLVRWLGGPGRYADLCNEVFRSVNDGASTSAIWNGNTYDCMLPWMSQVLILRRKLPGSGNPQGQLEWQAKMMALLQQQIPTANLMKAAQKDGFFFQVQVSGFRKGDHEAKDSENHELISSYVSDSVGTADQYAGAGALGTLADKTNLTNYEISAKFFSGGN